MIKPNMFNIMPKHGIQKKYYDNNQLKSESHYFMGTLNGITKIYEQNGILKSELKYFDGTLI